MKSINFKQDSGSVLLFGIGLGIIALIILTTAINVSSLWVTKSRLNNVVDATVLAASHSIDVDYVYENGISGPLWLSNSLTLSRTSSYLKKLAFESELSDFKLISIAVNQNSVQIVVSAKAELPFGYLLPGLDSTVFSSAKASIKTS